MVVCVFAWTVPIGETEIEERKVRKKGQKEESSLGAQAVSVEKQAPSQIDWA